jgi:hypothetical protein
MIAQHNGKIIRVDNKIIKPMTGKGPSSSDLLNPTDVASYLSYFYSPSTAADWDIPVIGQWHVGVNGKFGKNRFSVYDPPIWNYYYYLNNSSSTYQDYGELEFSSPYIGQDVMTSSVLASVFDGSGGGGTYGRYGKIYLNSNICFRIKDYYDNKLYSDAVEVSVYAADSDGTKTKVADGWTKSTDGKTASKSFLKIGATSTNAVFPWIRLTLIKSYSKWYAYVNDDLCAVFYAEIPSTNKIRFVGDGSGSLGGSIRFTETFLTATDIAAAHREKLNLIYEPTFDGNLPTPFYIKQV